MSSQPYPFEWILNRQTQRHAEHGRAAKGFGRHDADGLTNLEDPILAYGRNGLLSLADLKPTGFLIKSQG